MIWGLAYESNVVKCASERCCPISFSKAMAHSLIYIAIIGIKYDNEYVLMTNLPRAMLKPYKPPQDEVGISKCVSGGKSPAKMDVGHRMTLESFTNSDLAQVLPYTFRFPTC